MMELAWIAGRPTQAHNKALCTKWGLVRSQLPRPTVSRGSWRSQKSGRPNSKGHPQNDTNRAAR